MWDYTPMPSSDEFYHHGILGQKWGVRRYQNENGSLTPSGKKRYSAEHIDARELSKKGVSRLTNDELRRFNERMNLERNYRDLERQYKNNNSLFSKALTFTKDLLAVAKFVGESYDAYRKLKKIFDK